jgi:curved DNA-binding protein
VEFKDYYKVLGVDKTATADAIKKAYRKLARRYHPDVSKEADAAAKMAEVNEASAVLSDPEKRAAYDELSTQPRGGREFRPPPDWQPGFEFASGGGDEHFSDFFEELFGRAARARAEREHRPPSPSRGEDLHARIELELVDTYKGAQRVLSLEAVRVDEQGQLRREQRQLEVRIPKGVREGQHIRLAGQGGPGLNGGPSGDLLLEVVLRSSAKWRVEGKDVYGRLWLAPWEAALGASVPVRTPGDDTVEVTVPAGWRPGRKLRLKGRGIPAADPGDLYLELDVALPVASSEAERAAYAALAQAFPRFDARAVAGD